MKWNSHKIAEYTAMLAIWLGLALLFGMFSHNFLSARSFAALANRIPALVVVAAGMTLVLITGGIDLSVGSVLGLCGSVLGAAMLNHHLSFWAASLICLGIGALAGAVNGLVSVGLGIPSFIVTLGMLEVSTGWPSHYLHDYVANSQIFEDQLLSDLQRRVRQIPQVARGADESGVTWLPGFIWRAVKTWRGVRAEVPWVNRSPADIVREHMSALRSSRSTRRDRNAVERSSSRSMRIACCCSRRIIRTGSSRATRSCRRGLSADLQQKMRVENPLETYSRLKETVQ